MRPRIALAVAKRIFTEGNKENEDPIWVPQQKTLRYLRFLLLIVAPAEDRRGRALPEKSMSSVAKTISENCKKYLDSLLRFSLKRMFPTCTAGPDCSPHFAPDCVPLVHHEDHKNGKTKLLH